MNWVGAALFAGRPNIYVRSASTPWGCRAIGGELHSGEYIWPGVLFRKVHSKMVAKMLYSSGHFIPRPCSLPPIDGEN